MGMTFIEKGKFSFTNTRVHAVAKYTPIIGFSDIYQGRVSSLILSVMLYTRSLDAYISCKKPRRYPSPLIFIRKETHPVGIRVRIVPQYPWLAVKGD